MRPISSPNSSSSGSRSMSPAVGKCFIRLQIPHSTEKKTRGIINEATNFCSNLLLFLIPLRM